MHFARLEVSGVRNLEHVAIECSDRLNIFVGPIGAGKSAILESIHILARGRSFRSSATASVLRRGQDALVVRGWLQDEHRGMLTVRVARDRQDRGSAVLNGERVRRMSELAQVIPIQLVLPEVAKLVLGGPSERRRFVDSGVFHVKPRYLHDVLSYQKVIQQRNALLRRAGRNLRGSVAEQLDTWTGRLVELAEPIDLARREYVAALAEAAVGKLRELEPMMKACVRYQQGWRDGQALGICLTESLERDVRFAATHVGPHRGDLVILIDGDKAVDRLSRGQAKMLAIALHLAQAQLTDQMSGRKSIFLIDDIGSELDRLANERFLAVLRDTNCQVFATTASGAERRDWFSPKRVFHVEQGNCQLAFEHGATDV